ncbi:MAG: NAD(+) synthase [Nanoarchaeota archaeon]
MEKEIKLPYMDAEKVRTEIGDFVIRNLVEKGKIGCVMGLSGGVDSTSSAAIINRSFREYNAANNTVLELVGYILPSSTNKPEDARDGISVANRLGIRYEVIPIDGITQAHISATPAVAQSIYHKGNLMSRIRANILSTAAALENKLVAGTGNKDEDFGIGYYTLFGDGAVHLSPIGGLSKRLVREMATYLGFGNLANREPTAGLEPGQTDFGDLGYSYDLVELLSCGAEQGLTDCELRRHSAVKSLIERDMGLYVKKFGKPKFTAVDYVVDDYFRRHKIALQKAKIISPAIAPVSLQF